MGMLVVCELVQKDKIYANIFVFVKWPDNRCKNITRKYFTIKWSSTKVFLQNIVACDDITMKWNIFFLLVCHLMHLISQMDNENTYTFIKTCVDGKSKDNDVSSRNVRIFETDYLNKICFWQSHMQTSSHTDNKKKYDSNTHRRKSTIHHHGY